MGVPDVNPEGYEFRPGRAVTLREGRDVTLVATGTVVGRTLDAAELLAAQGVSARVLSMPTVKPLDVDAVVTAAAETGAIVTVEEALTTGLGGAVAVGVPDTFAPTGSAEWLLDHFGISPEGIARAAVEARAVAVRA
jgi:transketolase